MNEIGGPEAAHLPLLKPTDNIDEWAARGAGVLAQLLQAEGEAGRRKRGGVASNGPSALMRRAPFVTTNGLPRSVLQLFHLEHNHVLCKWRATQRRQSLRGHPESRALPTYKPMNITQGRRQLVIQPLMQNRRSLASLLNKALPHS